MKSMRRFRSLAIRLVPRRWQPSLAEAYLTLRNVWRARRYAGEGVACPCCGGRFRSFMPFGTPPRPQAKCPRCDALERHRLIWLYLREQTPLFTRSLRLLHFAPEYFFLRRLRRLPNLDYVSADLVSPLAQDRVDITALPYPDHSVDVIVCIDVLEHVPADRQAMRELWRVLKPGGWAILQAPIHPERPETDEDPTITSPEERARRFGQFDHVRLYGYADYPARLRAAGFEVAVVPYGEQLDPATLQRYGLDRGYRIYHCTRPV